MYLTLYMYVSPLLQRIFPAKTSVPKKPYLEIHNWRQYQNTKLYLDDVVIALRVNTLQVLHADLCDKIGELLQLRFHLNHIFFNDQESREAYFI